MSYTSIHEPHLIQARQTADKVLRAISDAGKLPVLLVPTYRAVLHERRRLASANQGFGITVDTLRSWPEDLWSLHGDGTTPIDSALRLTLLWDLLAENDTLTATIGKAKLLAACAACAMPYMAYAPRLSASENAAIDILLDYHKRIDVRGFIEPSEILTRLAASHALDPYGLVALGIDESALSFAQRAFLDACDAVVVVDDASAPCDADRNPEITQMLQTIFHRDSNGAAVNATGAVRCALAAGPSASVRLTVDAIDDLTATYPEGPLVITAKDPTELFTRIAPRLHRRGLSVRLQGRLPFEQTDAGRALIALSDLICAPAPDVLEACDYSVNPLSGTTRPSSFRTGKLLRGNRLPSHDSVLTDLAGNGGEMLMGVINRLEEQEYDEAIDLLQAYVDKRFAQRPSYRAIQSRALEAARGSLHAARQLDVALDQAIALLQGTFITLSQGENDDAAVCIMGLDDASQLEPSSARAILMCDMDASDYPIDADADALQTMLSKLDVAVPCDPLEQARAVFFRALQCASDRIIMQRPLHNIDTDETSPCVMFVEVLDCYRASLLDTADFNRTLGIPKSLVPFALQAGEQDVMLNLADITRLPEKEQATVSPLGTIGFDMRGSIVVPQLFGGRLYEGLSLSPSQIEAYLECPYQWFAKKRLKLVGIDEGFGPLEKGSFVHKVLERFYKQFNQAGDPKITDANKDIAHRLLDQVFTDTALAQDRDEQPGNRYAAATPGEKHQRAELLAKLQDYLETDARLLPSFSPTYFEWGYGNEVPFVYAGSNIRGCVDRIDVDANGCAVVIDYKTSISKDYRLHAKEPEGFVLPRKMQALIYSKAVRDLLGLRVVAALYVNPLTGEVRGAWDSHSVGPADIPFDKPIEEACGRIPYAKIDGFDTLLETSEAAVADKLTLLKEGRIEPDPLSSDVCTWCPVLLCPKRQGSMA